MMHANKNADHHVVDQNVDWISREIAYVPLGGRIRSKCSSCMQFFFFFEWVQNMLTWGQEDMEILVMHFKGPKVLDLGSYFQRTKDFLDFDSSFQRTKSSGSWLMFSEDQRFLGFGSCFQRTKDSGSWLMFSKDQGFLSFGSCF